MRPHAHPFYLNQCLHINKLVCLNSLNITCISKLTCCYELMSDAIRYLSLYTTAKLNVDWLLSSQPREKRSDTVVIGWKNRKDCKYIESLIFLHFRYHHITIRPNISPIIYKLVGHCHVHVYWFHQSTVASTSSHQLWQIVCASSPTPTI